MVLPSAKSSKVRNLGKFLAACAPIFSALFQLCDASCNKPLFGLCLHGSLGVGVEPMLGSASSHVPSSYYPHLSLAAGKPRYPSASIDQDGRFTHLLMKPLKNFIKKYAVSYSSGDGSRGWGRHYTPSHLYDNEVSSSSYSPAIYGGVTGNARNSLLQQLLEERARIMKKLNEKTKSRSLKSTITFPDTNAPLIRFLDESNLLGQSSESLPLKPLDALGSSFHYQPHYPPPLPPHPPPPSSFYPNSLFAPIQHHPLLQIVPLFVIKTQQRIPRRQPPPPPHFPHKSAHPPESHHRYQVPEHSPKILKFPKDIYDGPVFTQSKPQHHFTESNTLDDQDGLHDVPPHLRKYVVHPEEHYQHHQHQSNAIDGFGQHEHYESSKQSTNLKFPDSDESSKNGHISIRPYYLQGNSEPPPLYVSESKLVQQDDLGRVHSSGATKSERKLDGKGMEMEPYTQESIIVDGKSLKIPPFVPVQINI